MTGLFFNALVVMGIDEGIAHIVCKEFQKVEQQG